MSKIAGLVAAAVLAVASLSAVGKAASVALSGDDIGWDSMGSVSALHDSGRTAQSALTSDNVVESL
ncbi:MULTISPECIES: hypothetical protein [Streptomyces]|uniref:hypothetical protein n=1 Tax=Streptomyces TaxID=1883 RepID=UPI000C623940|nr:MULTISPECIES: hypothetical protein [Streptomyces]PIB05165.1 hypothetical protein B1C81_30005 [Streptomyces sp. HG99]